MVVSLYPLCAAVISAGGRLWHMMPLQTNPGFEGLASMQGYPSLLSKLLDRIQTSRSYTVCFVLSARTSTNIVIKAVARGAGNGGVLRVLSLA